MVIHQTKKRSSQLWDERLYIRGATQLRLFSQRLESLHSLTKISLMKHQGEKPASLFRVRANSYGLIDNC
jgi:hypothetical protein